METTLPQMKAWRGMSITVGMSLLAATMVLGRPVSAGASTSREAVDLATFMPAGMHLKSLPLTEQDLLHGVVAELAGVEGDRVAAKFVGPNSNPILGKGATLACRSLSGSNGKSWWRHHRGFEGYAVHRRVVDGVQTWWIKGVRGGVAATELVFAPSPGVACSVTVYGHHSTSQRALRYAGRMIRTGQTGAKHATNLRPVVRSRVAAKRSESTDSRPWGWKLVDAENPATTPCVSDWTDVNWVPPPLRYEPWAKYATVCANKHPHWGSTLIDWSYTCPVTPKVMAFFVGYQYNDNARYYRPAGGYAANWGGIHPQTIQPFSATGHFYWAFMKKINIRFWNPGTSGSDWTWPIFPCVEPNRITYP